MLGSLARFLSIVFRQRPPKLKVDRRFKVTIDMEKLRGRIPAKGDSSVSLGDVQNWLMKMGFSPTAKPDVWKAGETAAGRLPKAALIKSERLA